ncbi:MAG: DUF2062 domain-containing protein [Verrucomicrobia bacterium]|nr:DUF2062 domain-containing protein [Verrucomicrobiota bacterium]
MFEEKRRRIRRLKRWMRPLPRRSNMHRYPVLSWFAQAARKRIYLWSFRPEHAVPALQVGCILTLLPIYGLPLPLALVFALLLRANLPILAGLQLITNPFTVLPIWFALYQIGRMTLGLLAIESSPFGKNEIDLLINNFFSGNWGNNLDTLLSVFGITSLGAVIIGTFIGVITGNLHRYIAKRTTASYTRLHQKIEAHRHLKDQPNQPQEDA